MILRKTIHLLILWGAIAPSEEFLPHRTSRWWDNPEQIVGPPITKEEKLMSLKLRPPSQEDRTKRLLESSNLIEGDIYWAPNLQIPQENENRRALKALHTWPDGEIPYTIENTFNDEERLHVARAFGELETRSCVRFVPRDGDTNFIYIHKGKDCASNVGRIGGGQPLSLAPRCIQYGVIIHELLHSLGFWHEQSRYDRRHYINIHWANIRPLMLPNFLVSPYYFMSDVGLPYDYDSILHYGAHSFARNPDKPTISPKEDGISIGQRVGLSSLNELSVNRLYDCDSRAPGPGFHEYQDEEILNQESSCLDLAYVCFPLRWTGGCWWGDYVMRRYCRKTCGQCS